MATHLRWVGENEFDRVAETRVRCYAPAMQDLEKFKSGIRDDRRAIAGDFLLLEQDGHAVGTTTSMSLHLWMRGTRLPCQGVAFVGTIRTARRGGIAGQLMDATIAKAREREQIVTALMPFRASYYERFGYGFAERRTDWTIPLSLLPTADTSGLRYATDDDRPAIAALRQRFVERGQCDIETSAAGWALRELTEDSGFQIVEENTDGICGWAMLGGEKIVEGRATLLRVHQAAWDTSGNLLKLLSFLGGQRDQFSAGSLSLPGDFPLNRLLRETQLPHRPVPHAFAESKSYNRMQIRVLDHQRLLESMHMPTSVSGKFTVAVQESEGELSRWRIDLAEGRMTTKSYAGDCDVLCADRIWASIVAGDLRGRTAMDLGLVQCVDARAIELLDAFSDGPVPFCNEYF